MAGRGKGAFSYRIEVDPSPIKIARILGGLGKEYKNWRPAFVRMAPVLLDGLADNIKSKGGNLDEKWDPPNEEYQRRKSRLGHGRTDLVVSGKLLEEVTQQSSNSVRMTGKSLSVGTSLPYAPAVNFGRHANRIGRRVFMGWSLRMKADSIRIMNEHSRMLLDRAAQKMNALKRAA